MQKFHRKKIAMYFGNYINPKDLDLVYWAVNQNSISEFYSLIKTDKNFDISTINKRAILSIQLFFEYGYFPIFPEVFALAKNSEENIESISDGKPFSVMKNILGSPKKIYIQDDWTLRYEDREFVGDPSDLFQRNTSVLEAFMSSSADLIVNFMETNSSAVETGLYLNKENFKKTIIITPPQAQIEKVAVGEFTNYIIKELKPKGVKSQLYQRVSLFMELNKYKSSKDTSGFYTYLNPFEIPPLIARYLKKRSTDFSLNQNYKMVENSDEFYNMVHDIVYMPLETMTNKAIKKNLPPKTDIKTVYSKYSSIIDTLFARNSEVSVSNKVLTINRIASFFLLMTKQPNISKMEIEYYDIVKSNGKTRRIYPQPFSSRRAYKIASEMIYISNKGIENNVSHGYIKGKGIYEGLAKHIGNNSFVKLDITDFFGSLKRDKVKKITRELNIDNKFLFEKGDGVKQGYIISPVISNVYMIDFDNLAYSYSVMNKIVITRYADDILISGENLTDIQMNKVIKYVESILHPLGLKLNKSKTVKSRNSIHFLGLTLSQSGIRLSRRRKKVINRYKKMGSEKLSSRQWGIINYFKHIEKMEKERKLKKVTGATAIKEKDNENS